MSVRYLNVSPKLQNTHTVRQKKGCVLQSEIRDFTSPYIFSATVITLITRCKWRFKQE